MRSLLLLAALCPALALSTPGLAQPAGAPAPAPAPAPPPTSDEAAITALNKELAEHWDASQRGQLVYLGYHSAAAVMCDGLELDPAKLSKVVHESFLDGTEQASAEDKAKLRDLLYSSLSLSTGVFMGLNSHDTAGFCKRAMSERNSAKDSSSLFKD